MANPLRLAAIALCSLVCQLHAQWQVVAERDHLQLHANDGVIGYGGDLKVVVNEISLTNQIRRPELWSIGEDGTVIDSIFIELPGKLTFGDYVYRTGADSMYLVTGQSFDPTQPLLFGRQGIVAEITNSTPVIRHFGINHYGGGNGNGFIDDDGSLVFGQYYFHDLQLFDMTFHATRYCIGSGTCDSVFIYEQLGQGRMHSMAKVPNTGIAGIMPSTSESCNLSGLSTVLFNTDLDTTGCYSVYPVDPGVFNSPSLFLDNLSMLPLVSGNILLCGAYDKSVVGPIRTPTAIQRSTIGYGALDEQSFYNAADSVLPVRPATLRGMSPFNDHEFAFAYSDNARSGGPDPYYYGETSNVHVLRMDTALNILGEYVFNGDSINRYHFLASVVAAPDGSVYAMGSVLDYDDVQPRTKLWVAKVAPEQFVRVPELARTSIMVYPNPSSGGFVLNSDQALTNAAVQVFDPLGKLVMSTLLNGTSVRMEAENLPAGMYIVRVMAKDGSSWSTRWVRS